MIDDSLSSQSSNSDLQLVWKPVAPYRQPLLLVVEEDDDDESERELDGSDKDETGSKCQGGITNLTSLNSHKKIGRVTIDAIKERGKDRKKSKADKRKKDKKNKNEERAGASGSEANDKEKEMEFSSSKVSENNMTNELSAKLNDLLRNSEYADEAAATPSSSSNANELPRLSRPKSAAAVMQSSNVGLEPTKVEQVVKMLVKKNSNTRPSTAVPKKSSTAVADPSNLHFGSVTKLTDWQHHTFVSPKHETLAQLHAAHHSKKQGDPLSNSLLYC